MNRAVTTLLVFLLLTPSFVPAMTTANEPPLADAGLDQNVARGATVLLDASGSHDPDGQIDQYKWSITTPDGQTTMPACSTCPRTRFRPNSVGTYVVSLTVTDKDGATTHDSLYVTVSPGEKPSVSVSGPRQSRVGEKSVFSATVHAGAASLDRIVWSLDGETIASRSLTGSHSSETITRTFADTGTRTITATVYDSDGQTGTDSATVTVQPPQNDPSQDTLADEHTPKIAGDDLVTGSAPLRGTYNLQSSAHPTEVRSIRWMSDAKRIGSGQTETESWVPGDHSLYAIVTYTDGSRDIARFADGSTTVTADPKPSVELSSLDDYGSVSGRASAVDRYENLQSIIVRLGGTVIGHRRMDGTPGEMQRRQVSTFDYREFEPGKTYTVAVTAVDSRGQKSVSKREVTPVKEPVIIESGFVNGPVDSYHERIDPERYTARHVIKIDLNGVDPEDVVVTNQKINSQSSVSSVGSAERVSTNNGLLIVSSYWTAEEPGKYDQNYIINIHKNELENTQKICKSVLHVEPSSPELRVEVINDGTSGFQESNWGIVVDASGSFDPDGTKLNYIWQKGAEPITPDNKTGKFSSVKFARLKIRDGYDLTTAKEFNYLENFAPEIRDVQVLSEGPYKPNDTVRLRVATEKYRFTKNTYHDQFELEVSTIGVSGEVVSWEKKAITHKGDDLLRDDPKRYVGIIEIKASELATTTEEPKIRVYNAKDSTTHKEVAIPNLEVYREYGTIWTNISIEETEYLVKRPTYSWELATTSEERDQYLSNGYSVANKQRDGFEYTLEERVKVQDAKYETKSKTFSTELEQSAFLQTHSDWWSAGHDTEKKTWTTTEHEWRDSKTGEGTFTGETRRVETEPAEYRTEKQYAYEHEVEKTGTRTVTKTREVEVTKTDTMYVTKCGDYGICWDVPKTYTYTTTETETYTTTEEYTYTVTRTETYWAYQKLGWDHSFTGNRKKVKVNDAKYETQYLFEYLQDHTEVSRVYEVSTREKVQDAKYEWQEHTTTTDRQVVESLTADDDWRIGSYEANVKWGMQKRTGRKTTTVDVYFENDEVLTTNVTADVDVTKQYVRVGNNTIKNETVGSRTVAKSYQYLVSESEIKRKLRNHHKDPGDSCEDKFHCYR